MAGLMHAGAVFESASGSPSTTWLALLVVLLGSSVIGGIVTGTLGSVRAAATTRRDGYAQAVRTLIARVEFPYRIRRRVSDEPEVLAALAARGNDLQEQLAGWQTWVNAESPLVGRIYNEVLRGIDKAVKPASSDAWIQPPIATAHEMNLGGGGPGDQSSHIARLERAIACRFGWRRIVPGWVWGQRFSRS